MRVPSASFTARAPWKAGILAAFGALAACAVSGGPGYADVGVGYDAGYYEAPGYDYGGWGGGYYVGPPGRGHRDDRHDDHGGRGRPEAGHPQGGHPGGGHAAGGARAAPSIPGRPRGH